VCLITEFDPWHSSLCTCPRKLTFNPYTGCDHMCLYCYASAYIPRFFNCRPKKNLIQRLAKEAAKLKGETLSISNSSDPYPNIEAKTQLTRQCLQVLTRQECKLQIITKSDLVTRDIDLLAKKPSMVSITVTTDNDKTARLIEPHAPPPSKRLKAAKTLIKQGIPATIRIDPIIPYLNDNPQSLIEAIAATGVKHVTSSTLKLTPQNWKQIKLAHPELAEKLEPLYFKNGEKTGHYTHLNRQTRFKLLNHIAQLASKHGLKFGTCREGLASLNTVTCDGSWLLRKTNSKRV